jgi:hypothetical protein
MEDDYRFLKSIKSQVELPWRSMRTKRSPQRLKRTRNQREVDGIRHTFVMLIMTFFPTAPSLSSVSFSLFFEIFDLGADYLTPVLDRTEGGGWAVGEEGKKTREKGDKRV